MRPRPVLAVALLALLPLAVFALSLDNGFHLDDYYRVVDNPGIRSVAPMLRHFSDPGTSSSLPRLEQYRPLLPLTLSWNFALSGDDPRGYRLGNLALHIGAALLLWRLFRRLLGRLVPGAEWVALGAALLFAVHPVAAIPINYLCARDLLLMQFFLAAGLLAWASGHGLLALLCVALSLLGKTNAIMAPALIFVLAWLFPRPGPRPRFDGALRAATPFALVVAGFFAFTTWGLGFSDVEQLGLPATTWHQRLGYLWTQLDLHWSYYLRNVFWSGAMRPLPEVGGPRALTDLGPWVGLLLLLGSLALAWRWRVRRPGLSFALAAWWLLFVPTSSVAPLRYAATDYRAYPSLAFLLLVLCAAGARWLPARARVPAFAVALVLCAAGSLEQNRLWKDEATLWGRAVELGARPMAHVNLGRALQAGQPERAREHYRLALAREPGNVVGRLNLGLLEIRSGQPELGLAQIERAVADGATWPQSHYWHARALMDLGRLDEAALAAERATLLQPDHADYRALALRALYESGYAAGQRQHWALCLDRLGRLHALTPVYLRSRFSEGWARQSTWRPAAAAESYALHLGVYGDDDPDAVQVHFNLGVARMDANHLSEAIAEFEAVLELAPDRSDAHLHLADCYERLGREEEATAHRQAYERDRVLGPGAGAPP